MLQARPFKLMVECTWRKLNCSCSQDQLLFDLAEYFTTEEAIYYLKKLNNCH
ncbi:MAG: hypothetical protein OFPI_16120 [Osedax symbiont Rs2]|nr:MAG: hypothetical protein OFPI_16120 [Osedax symbiont Rs2]